MRRIRTAREQLSSVLDAASEMPIWALAAHAMALGAPEDEAFTVARSVFCLHLADAPSFESLRGMFAEVTARIYGGTVIVGEEGPQVVVDVSPHLPPSAS